MIRARYTSRTTLFIERLKARKNRAKRDAIYSVSGLIARSAKQSLRIRRGASRPGAIPHAHTKGGLRVIMFAVDTNKSIIGPIRFPRSRRYNEPAPHIQEFGSSVIDYRAGKIITFPARPFMSVTLSRLRRKGLIPKQFSASIARII